MFIFIIFQATVSSAGTFLYYLSVLLASQIPPVLVPEIGLPGIFGVFASLVCVFLVIVLVWVQETQGNTLAQHLELQERQSRGPVQA